MAQQSEPTPPETALRAAIYTRVSTDDQAREGFSMPEQDRRGRELIEREEGWEYAGTYSDPGISGAVRDRPGLDRLLADVAAGLINVVVVIALDRLSRDAGHLRELLLTFDAAGVRVVASGQALDRATPEGRLQTGILAEFAEFEREKIRERVKVGIAGRAREGKPWGEPGYGYRKGDDGHWVENAAESAVARRVYRLRVDEGLSYNAVATKLNREGVPTRRGSRWTATVVRRLVTSKHVLGFYEHAGEWHEGQHDAIVDRGTWEDAQALAVRDRRYAPRGGGGRLPRRHVFVRGTLRCGCGAAMLPRSADDQADTYVCRTHKADSAACPTPPLKRADLDRAALRTFEETALDYEATRAHVEQHLRTTATDARAQLLTAEREAAGKRAALARFDRDYEAGDLTAANYERQVARVSEELAALDAQTAQLAAHATDAETALADLDAESETLRRLTDLRAAVAEQVRGAARDVPALRAAMTRVFARFWVVPDPHRPGEYGLLPEPRPEMVNALPYDADRGVYVRPDDYERLRRVPIALDPDYETSSGVPE